METKDFKRTISIYDNYTINEVIKAIKEAREEIEKFNQRESEIREEKNAKGKEISAEEKEEYNAKIQQVKEERKPIKDYLSKLERKKKGLLTRLDKKIKEIETKNSDMQKEIERAKEIINANEKLAEDFGVESTGLEEEMQELKDAISIRETKINKNVEKLNKLYRIFSDVENENVVEGLQPNVVKSYKNLPKDQIFKNSGESVRSIAEEERTEQEIEADDENLGIDESQEQEIEQQEEQTVKTKINEEISSLEEQIRKSAERMKEYRETGNYEQEAAEHAYYNSLVAKMNDLKGERSAETSEKKSEIDEREYNIGKNIAGMVERGEVSEDELPELGKKSLAYYREISGEKKPETDKHKYNIGKNIAGMVERGEVSEDELPELGKEALAYYREKKDKVEEITQGKQSAETVKTEPVQAKQPAETVKTQTTQVKQPTETAKAQTTQAKQSTETAKAQTTQAKQQTETVKTQTTQVKQPTETVKTETAKKGPEKTEPKSEIKWNSKLTQDQIEELIADGIEPGDNEYNLYLWNHGINPFEDKMKPKQPIETVKTVADPVLEKYKNDGFSKNAFGWYFNPWKDEFDKDYDPHNDPEYNEKLKESKVEETERTSANNEVTEKNETEEKHTKVSILQKIKDRVSKIINTIKGYIANFNNKQLSEGAVSEQEKEEYVAKANEILKETLSTDRVFDAKSRAAMQGREEFLAGIHISKELREEIDAQEEVEEELYIPEDVKEEMSKKEEAER